MRHKWTEAQKEFLRNNSRYHTSAKLTKLINQEFNTNISAAKIISCCKNLKLSIGSECTYKTPIYAVYRGNDCIAIGTLEEVVKESGMAKKTVQHLVTPSYQNSIKNKDFKDISHACRWYEN